MKKLGRELSRITHGLAGKDDTSRIARRVAEVHAIWKDAVEQLYKERAYFVLSHTNAVYIKEENGQKHLIVYLDDGGVRSDIHCQQHFLLMWLQEIHGEKIEVFRTLPSRFEMRNKHPYENYQPSEKIPRRKALESLSEEEKDQVKSISSAIENDRVRAALVKAMSADLEWKKSEIEEK